MGSSVLLHWPGIPSNGLPLLLVTISFSFSAYGNCGCLETAPWANALPGRESLIYILFAC